MAESLKALAREVVEAWNAWIAGEDEGESEFDFLAVKIGKLADKLSAPSKETHG